MKVLNFGSLNIDYTYHVSHFVQKGETLLSDMSYVYSGGKGLNQSIALKRAGVDVFHAGAVGTDGNLLVELLKDSGVDTKFIKIFPNIRTGNAIIQNDSQGDNCIIVYGGANQAITKEMADEVLQEFGAEDFLVLQNEISEIPYIVEQAHKKGMTIVLNPSPINENIFRINLDFIDCFILNEGEAKALVSLKENEEVLLEQLRKKFPCAEIILTLGEKGSVYAGKEGVIKQEAYKIHAVDTTAAGDTFTGYFLAGRLQGMDVKDALDMASRASAVAVSRKGAAPSIPVREEIFGGGV